MGDGSFRRKEADADDNEETMETAAKRHKKMEEVSLANLMSVMKTVLSEQKKQGEELKVLKRYQDSGTTPLIAACSLVEFAVETASSVLRKIVAEDHAILDYRVHQKVFRKLFHEGYVENIDFCRVVLWIFKSARLSLGEYWLREGYTPDEPLCESWYDDPDDGGEADPGAEEDNGIGELRDFVKRTEEELAQQIDVPAKDLSLFLWLYCTAVRNTRNKAAHFCSVYSSTTRSKNQGGRKERFPTKEDYKEKLQEVMYPLFKLQSLADLRMRYWVMERLEEQVGELEWFQDHAPVFLAFSKLLRSKFAMFFAYSVHAASAEKAAEFGCFVTRSETEVMVEKNGCCFRYGWEKQVWERKCGDNWEVEEDAWKHLLGV